MRPEINLRHDGRRSVGSEREHRRDGLLLDWFVANHGRCGVRTVVLLVGAAGLATAACDPPSGDSMEFVVRVDSITGPSVIPSTEILSIRFWGHVGPDQCSRVAEVDKARGDGIFEITFHAERSLGRDCGQMPVLLEHEERLEPPLTDPFTIRARQPEGAPLEKIVRIQ